MNLKPIELQIAIPRTVEAGTQQQQMLQRPAAEQANLAQQSAKQTEIQRRSAGEVTETEHRRIRDDDPGNGGGGKRRSRQQQAGGESPDPEESKPAHPYKGHRIDITF